MYVVAIVGDTHTNSTLGLCPLSGVELDEGGTYKPNKVQRALWKAWEDFTDTVVSLRDLHGAKLCTIFNGDICDGDHHNTTQIISRSEATMFRIVHKTLSKLYDESDVNFVTRGTRAHRGASGSIEEKFAEDIGAVKDPLGGSFSWGHALLNIEGVLIDIAHHATMGRLPWTMKNAGNSLASRVLFQYANRRERIPHLAFRSHNHRYADSYTHYAVRGICLPAWQGVTEHIESIDPGAVADIGGAIVLCKGGKYEVIIKQYALPSRAGGSSYKVG